MGDKIEARQTAINAKVSVIPGLDNAITSPAEARAFAEKAGLPVMLKAAFGGGGRGMREIHKMEVSVNTFLPPSLFPEGTKSDF